MPSPAPSAEVVRFGGPRASRSPYRDQKGLLDAVYGAGALPVPAADAATKRLAARLQVLGFVDIVEIAGEGARRLRPSEAIRADLTHPWRLARPRRGESRAP